MNILDQAQPIRPGETLDVAALARYLSKHLPNANGALSIEQFPRGFSNLTYLLRLGDQELVLRRPPFGAAIQSAHDMGREYRVLHGLRTLYAKAPRPLLYCDDASVIGAPFYVMERLHGVILRGSAAASLGLTPEEMRRIAVAAIDTLAELHALDYAAAGLGELGRPAGYVARQVEGWTNRYRAAQTDDLAPLEALAQWLATHQPTSSGAALIHNDYKFDNLMLNPHDLGEIIAVLDWEMCTIGDPLMDLGTTLGYWIEPGDPPALQAMLGLTASSGNLSRREVVARYTAASGRQVDNPLFYYLYGLFKIAVIVQQIYARYRRGHTQDARFAGLDEVVNACGRLGVAALEQDRIDALGAA
ncbi:MAG: phosphotransferase family protein [Anaerolineales bacterium]|nr:phosphotransferase family protein [Anaerolineales bacterium]